jgi:hypothetical protein
MNRTYIIKEMRIKHPKKYIILKGFFVLNNIFFTREKILFMVQYNTKTEGEL